jgi:superfamily I DNA/RNA helicase
VDYYAMAGDPYQAIYLFSGAEPDLFINHPGDLVPLGDSRRLTSKAAQTAQGILRGAGYREGTWLGTWDGIGDGIGREDGSVFYLARTARLLDPVYRQLEDAGIAYSRMRGGGPLSTKAARAFNILLGLRRTGVTTNSQLAYLVEQCDANYLPVGELRLRKLQARSDPDGHTGLDDLRQRWQKDPNGENLGIARGDYFERVNQRYGRQAFTVEPSIKVGTIHAAKGREADLVFLVDSWATLPYQNATDGGRGQLAEACVAYVAVTRHRRELHILPSFEGTPYPGF